MAKLIHFTNNHELFLCDKYQCQSCKSYLDLTVPPKFCPDCGRRVKEIERAVCGATRTIVDQHGATHHLGPCVLNAGHKADDGRPDGHSDGENIWGGE